MSVLRTPATLVALVTAISLGACGGGNEGTVASSMSPSGLTRIDQPLDAEHLYVGVSCGTGNEISCDGIRLSVEVPSEPSFVYATVDGHRTKLTRVANTDRIPAYYQGGILAPGLLHEGPLAVEADDDGRWIGRKPVFFPMTLRAVYGKDDTYAEESFEHVRLYPGFG